MKVYVIMYEGNINSKGFDTIDKAINYLIEKGATQCFGWVFEDENGTYTIHEVEIG